MRQSIHNHEKKHEQALQALHRRTLPPGAREDILAFDHYQAARGMTHARRIKYLTLIPIVASKLEKPLRQATTQDLTTIIAEIEGKPYSPWTKATYRNVIKRFWKWLKGHDKKYPKEVNWIRTNLPPQQRPLPKAEDLLTETEILALLSAAKHPRDRALVSILWESGGRIGEIGTLTVNDVRFDKHGALLSVTGKTGPRQVRIIQSVPLLANWLQFHPLKDQRDAPLWITTSNNCRGKQIKYNGLRKKLRDLARTANIKKRVNPHSFRHARATFLAKHLTEFQMNQYLGWTQGSDMPSTYVHLSGRETDDALLKLNGIQPDKSKDQESLLKPRVCSRCDTINDTHASFCRKCGNPLELSAALAAEQKEQEAETVLAELLQDPAVQEVVQEALIRRKLRTPLTRVKQPPGLIC